MEYTYPFMCTTISAKAEYFARSVETQSIFKEFKMLKKEKKCKIQNFCGYRIIEVDPYFSLFIKKDKTICGFLSNYADNPFMYNIKFTHKTNFIYDNFTKAKYKPKEKEFIKHLCARLKGI